MDSHDMNSSTLNVASENTNRQSTKAMLKEYPDVMDIEHISKILGVSIKTCYRLLRSAQIAYLRIGRAYRIPKPCLMDYLNSAKTHQKYAL